VALHAAKTLVTEHPGAALHVAGSSASFAVKTLAQDGLEIAHEGLDAVIHRVERMTDALTRSTAEKDTPPIRTTGPEDDPAT
jgi:hypothetical protein